MRRQPEKAFVGNADQGPPDLVGGHARPRSGHGDGWALEDMQEVQEIDDSSGLYWNYASLNFAIDRRGRQLPAAIQTRGGSGSVIAILTQHKVKHHPGAVNTTPCRGHCRTLRSTLANAGTSSQALDLVTRSSRVAEAQQQGRLRTAIEAASHPCPPLHRHRSLLQPSQTWSPSARLSYLFHSPLEEAGKSTAHNSSTPPCSFSGTGVRSRYNPMETDHRTFQPVNIGMTSVETGRERFTKDEIYTLPPISYWRCNLTALSQRYNLYFVASNDGIAVYQPEFPFQKLKRTPQLFIPLAIANPKAAGYIEPAQPHSANHILVGDLGNEEIILAATDSGNIVAYHTKAINEAIQKDPYRFSTNARSDYVGVRAFFSHWVFESAWGLAIHREGRMIAVSANVPHHVSSNDLSAKITVFAFALSQPVDTGHTSSDFRDVEMEGEAEWYEWDPVASSGHSPTRDRNFKITLAGIDGHKSNIPSVSFVNTCEDVEGSWLLSTDIHGDMKIWHIWRGTCYSSSDFAESGDRIAPWMRRREGGWLVAALDPLSFRLAKSMDQFCGHSKAKKYYGHVGESYDITNVVRARTPGNSQTHPLFHEISDEDDQLQEDDEVDSWHEEEDDHASLNDEDRAEENTILEQTRSLEPTQYSLLEGAQLARDSNVDEDSHAANSSSAGHPSQVLSLEAQLPRGQETLPQLSMIEAMVVDQAESDADVSEDNSINEWYDEVEDNDAQDHSESEEHELSFSPISHGSATSASSLPNRNSDDMEEERVFVTRPSFPLGTWSAFSKKVPTQYAQDVRRAQREKELTKTSRIPFIPTLHCSTSHIRIVNAPQATSPHIFGAHILKQILPPGLEVGHQAHFDRLNMMQQIPELGIAIIATQIGRCAVCTLTKKEETGILGIRIDWILPTKKQERAGVRPFGPLLGIAVAPVQGRAVKRPEVSLDDGMEDSWALDQNLDGVLTTFDSNVLVLGRRNSSTDGNEAVKEKRHAGDQTPVESISTAKRKSFSSESSGSSHAVTEKRHWKKPEGTESWQSAEASRRYRLMMTYSDMTVLTYEIYRGVEKNEVAGAGISGLESVD